MIKNDVNNKVYIGSSINLERGLKDHLGRLRQGKHCNSHLQHSWDKYGEGHFEIHILELPSCVDAEHLVARETEWIEVFNALNPDYGFNYMIPNAAPLLDETRRNMSESKKGMFTGSKNSFFGKTHTEESKAKISASRKGKTVGDNHPMYGKRHSDETKEKMREAKLGVDQPQSLVDKRVKAIRMNKRNSQKYKGVYFDKARKKYQAYVDHPTGRVRIGRFVNEEDAARHHDYYAIKAHGKGNCYLNFPDEDYDTFQPTKVIALPPK